MGMTKNTGNRGAGIVSSGQAVTSRISVGVTSIGRDGGDRHQALLSPSHRFWSGRARLVTRSQRAKSPPSALTPAGIHSLMGEIVVVKVLDYGEMEIAGASRGADHRRWQHRWPE